MTDHLLGVFWGQTGGMRFLFWGRLQVLCSGFEIGRGKLRGVLRDGSVDMQDRIVVWWEGSGICRVHVVVARCRLLITIL